MRRFNGSRRARCSGGTRDSFEVQRDNHGLAFDKRESQIGSVGHSGRARTVDPRMRNALEQAPLQTVPQAAHAFALRTLGQSREFSRLAHTRNGSYVLGSRTAIPFRVAAVEQKRKLRSFSDVQRAHSFRSAKFV